MAANETSIIHIDKSSFDYWRGGVDSVLSGISRTMDEVNTNLKSLNEWKGSITGRLDQTEFRLDNHDILITEQSKCIKDLAEQTQKVVGAIDQISRTIDLLHKSTSAEEDAENEDTPTFKWFTEKLGMPVIVAGITFLLFTIMPSIFMLVYLLPKLASAP
jgi:methyl-accepting chemotaxis protein